MGSKAIAVNQGSWEAEVLKSETPVLVDFWAEWCPPCKMLDPIVDQIAEEYEGQVRVVKVDGDTNPEIVQAYGVFGLPTLILFKNGEDVARITGFKPKGKILNELTPHFG